MGTVTYQVKEQLAVSQAQNTALRASLICLSRRLSELEGKGFRLASPGDADEAQLAAVRAENAQLRTSIEHHGEKIAQLEALESAAQSRKPLV
jgi:hypothetical protein